MKSVFIIICLLFSFQNVSAEIYKYTDEKGNVHITDDIGKIPKKYSKEREQITKIIVRNNSIFIPVTITYQGRSVTVQMTLDTGANGISITQALATKLGITKEGARAGATKIADGSVITTYAVTADRVKVGTKSKSNIDLHIMPNKENTETGLLGMSFLGEFPHTINMRKQIITWL